jgi:hypothetical protein
MSKKDLEKALEKDLEKEINILEHEIFIERVLTRAMGKNTISLRDHFAGLAMQGILANAKDLYWDYEKLALTSYEQADAMLKEREKRDV